MRLFIAVAAAALALPMAAHAEWTAELNAAQTKATGYGGYYSGSYHTYQDDKTGAEIGAGYNFRAGAFRIAPVVGAFVTGEAKAYGKIEAVYNVSDKWAVGIGGRSGEDHTDAYGIVSYGAFQAFAGSDYLGIGLRHGF